MRCSPPGTGGLLLPPPLSISPNNPDLSRHKHHSEHSSLSPTACGRVPSVENSSPFSKSVLWMKLLLPYQRKSLPIRCSPPGTGGLQRLPASRYQPSQRAYQANPPDWEYPSGAVVKRLNSKGLLAWHRQYYFVSQALPGEWVEVNQSGSTLLIRYRHMWIRQIDTETEIVGR